MRHAYSWGITDICRDFHIVDQTLPSKSYLCATLPLDISVSSLWSHAQNDVEALHLVSNSRVFSKLFVNYDTNCNYFFNNEPFYATVRDKPRLGDSSIRKCLVDIGWQRQYRHWRPIPAGIYCLWWCENIDFESLVAVQEHCINVNNIRFSRTALQPQQISLHYCSGSLCWEAFAGIPRPFNHKVFHWKVVYALQNHVHLGSICLNYILLIFLFGRVFNNEHTLAFRANRLNIVTQSGTFSCVSFIFQHMHIYIIVPLTVSRVCFYLLLMIVRFTRFPVAVPIQNITTVIVALNFVNYCISFFGVPAAKLTDKDIEFENTLLYEITGFLISRWLWAAANYQ